MNGPRPAGQCPHRPPCPASSQHDRLAAAVISAHPEQGWSLLCNGVVVFDDVGDLLPDGTAHGPPAPRPRAGADDGVNRVLAAVPAGVESPVEALLEALGKLQPSGGRGAGCSVLIQVSDGEITGECELTAAQAAALELLLVTSRSR